jgi:hypothetical protein
LGYEALLKGTAERSTGEPHLINITFEVFRVKDDAYSFGRSALRFYEYLITVKASDAIGWHNSSNPL